MRRVIEGTIKGLRTNCLTGKTEDVELIYSVRGRNNKRLFRLHGGVTGYESFYIEDAGMSLDDLMNYGWVACAGIKDGQDKLVIPAPEMRRVLKPLLGD